MRPMAMPAGAPSGGPPASLTPRAVQHTAGVPDVRAGVGVLHLCARRAGLLFAVARVLVHCRRVVRQGWGRRALPPVLAPLLLPRPLRRAKSLPSSSDPPALPPNPA